MRDWDAGLSSVVATYRSTVLWNGHCQNSREGSSEVFLPIDIMLRKCALNDYVELNNDDYFA